MPTGPTLLFAEGPLVAPQLVTKSSYLTAELPTDLRSVTKKRQGRSEEHVDYFTALTLSQQEC